MRCKKHLPDLSSTVGICASCLRERLFSIIAAQVEARGKQQAELSGTDDELCRKSDPQPLLTPPRFDFSRSVSDDCSWNHQTAGNRRHHQSRYLFYSTPQVGPTYSASSTFVTPASCGKKRKGKFWLWSGLFSSRSEKFESENTVPSRNSTARASDSHTSWLSLIFSGRRKKQSRLFSVEDSAASVVRGHSRTVNRGMSPAIATESDEDCDDHSVSVTDYSSECSQKWRRSPLATAPGSARRGRPGHSRNGSGLSLWFSPLVRASPNWQLHQKALPPEIAFSGETRVPAKPHLAAAASFCANRSRKLADFGRLHPNR